MDAVNVERVFKNYRIYSKPVDRLKELFQRRKKCHTDFWALSDVTFTVKRGTTFGVIGENGSGKSTLLQIIAGTLQPTSGQVSLGGRVAALLELGDLIRSFRQENVFLNAAIMGLSTSEIEEKFLRLSDLRRLENLSINRSKHTRVACMSAWLLQFRFMLIRKYS
jgi:ABC-type polysaccharide/polyol phosphate transport system ATPase subunit